MLVSLFTTLVQTEMSGLQYRMDPHSMYYIHEHRRNPNYLGGSVTPLTPPQGTFLFFLFQQMLVKCPCITS